MSLASMTEVAVQRRSDVGTPGHVPKTHREIAAAADGKEGKATAVNTALQLIVTYIPTEVIALYLAIVAALQPAHVEKGAAMSAAQAAQARTPEAVFIGFLIFTPISVWLVYAAKVKSDGKRVPVAPSAWPVWEMVAGSIAFTAWAIALPQQPFQWINSAVAGVVVLGTSTVLGLLAPLFSRRINISN